MGGVLETIEFEMNGEEQIVVNRFWRITKSISKDKTVQTLTERVKQSILDG